MSKKEMDKIVKEVKDKLGAHPKQKQCNKCSFIFLGVTVLAGLVALILYIKSKQDEDIEEYYEYFDDDLDDDDDDDMYEDLSDEDDLDVEYLEIKDFEDNDDEE